jgi:RNA recognition motif-containing protein
MIHIIRERATKEQLQEMLEVYKEAEYIKLAVDIERGVAAGGAEMHYECEEALLEAGSQQNDIWGAGWYWQTKKIRYDSLINRRPKQNRSDEVEDPLLRKRIENIILKLFDGVEP